jgi:DNA polymerase-3 subunit delta'
MDKLEHPDVHFSFPIRLEKSSKTCHHHVVDWRKQVLDNPYLDLDEWTDHHAINKNVLMGVDEVAEINSKLSLRSYSGGYKVVLVWYPERMNPQGANKLLKAIEEPPERTLFILVAENSEALLPTIISRTQRVRVPLVDHSSLAAFVQSAYELQWETALDVALRSEGDVLEAHHVASTEENALLPIFRNWMLSCYYRKVDDTKDVCDSFHALGREGQKRFIRYGLQKIRQCVLFDQGLGSLVHAVDEEKMFLQKFTKFIDLETAEWFREEFDRMHRHLDRNASGKVMFMDTSFQLYQRLNR